MRVLSVVGKILVYILLAISLLLSFSVSWATNYFGLISMDEIVYTLSASLEGTAKTTLINYFLRAFCPAFVTFVILVLLIVFIKGYVEKKQEYHLVIRIGNRKKISICLVPLKNVYIIILFFICIGLVGVIRNVEKNYHIRDYVRRIQEKTTIYEELYTNPAGVELRFPEEKRNLIYIYMESAESTLQDIENGGMFENNYIPELTALAKDNISFSQSELIEGACVAPGGGWTMAALISQTAGIPLKSYINSAMNTQNEKGQSGLFLPGAVSLGEILNEAGYNNYFMCGSDIVFGGRANYFEQHGGYEIWDYNTAIQTGKIPEDYYVWWGYEDIKLYEYAKEEILKLAESDAPFNFTMLTVDTHAGHEGGYLCEQCSDVWDTQYANVWSCASHQVFEFVEWIKKQEFYEDTTIIIVGDHCSMQADFFGKESYDQNQGEAERKVYNVIINASAEPIYEDNRLFTTLDMYPTTLAALGVEIEGDRLGFGTNLFSEEKTLSEQYGYDWFFEELGKSSNYYNINIAGM